MPDRERSAFCQVEYAKNFHKMWSVSARWAQKFHFLSHPILSNTCQKKIGSGTASESSARPFWWTQSSDFWQIIRYPHLAKPLAPPHLKISGYRHGSQVGITIPHQLRGGIQYDTMPAHGYWPIAPGSNQIEALAVLSTNPTHLPNTSICAPPNPLLDLLKLDFSTRNRPSRLTTWL